MYEIERWNLSYSSPTNFALWSRMLANQKVWSPKVDDSWDKNDPVDV